MRAHQGKGKTRPLTPTAPIEDVLTPERIKEIASKQWRNQGMSVYLVSIMDGKIHRVKAVKRMTGPKTVEGKVKSLQNLRFSKSKPPEITLEDLYSNMLCKEEEQFYEARQEQYRADFPNMNESSDRALLHEILMCEITLRRLRIMAGKEAEKIAKSAKTKNAGRGRKPVVVDYSQQIKLALEQMNKLLTQLNATRKDRMRTGEKQDKGLGELVNKYSQQADLESLSAEERRQLEEEEREAQLKIQRDALLGVQDGLFAPGEIYDDDDSAE